MQVVAEVEVRDESVTQILGGEIVQRCPGHGSCDRGDIVSLIIDFLHELRQCWPVALSEESLVELAGQGAHRCSGRIGAAPVSRLLTSLTPCRGLVAARRGSMFHSLTWASRVCRTAVRGTLRRELMVLLPWSQHSGGRAATTRAASSWACSGGRLVSRSSTSRSPSGRAWSSTVVSACRAVEGQQIGRVAALREQGVSGVEAVGGEDPEVAFGGDPAGDVGVGGHDRVLADGGELAGLLIG